MTTDVYWVTLNCPRCGEVYRSRRPLSAEDRLEPDLFHGNGGPPTEERPTCPSCRRDLVLSMIPVDEVGGASAPAAQAGSAPGTSPSPPAAQAASACRPVRVNPTGLQVLFEVGEGEQLLNLLPTETGILIITTRRLALLSLT